MPENPLNNIDIYGVAVRCNLYITELVLCPSAKKNSIEPADKERVKSYLAELKAYIGWIGTESLDTPKVNPKPLPAPAVAPKDGVINPLISDLISHLELLRDELLNSQSKVKTTALEKFDKQRADGVLARAEKFIAEYLEKSTPVDLPENA